ncbi:MAG: T9SS type A sorting domain-containing protein [Ignavibacteria bacterium]
MKKIVLFLISLIIFTSTLYSQVKTYDDFSKKDLSAWIWGGIEMKYSHEEDNRENGFVEIFSTQIMKSSSYVGKVTKYFPMLLSAGNYLNFMLQGVNDEATVKIQILYDIDNNGKYNEDKDIILQSKPVSLNFRGWKEVKIKLDEDNFSIVSKFNDDFTVTEEEAIGIQFEYETGKNFKDSKFVTGIALISEIQNKDSFTQNEKESNTSINDKESYFNAKNYPNPFNPTTTISFTLQESSYVKLTVYDRLGREVKTLIDENRNAGTHTTEFNASGLPSGIYFYRIKTDSRTEVRKMILAK